jgi:hypothetical protein
MCSFGARAAHRGHSAHVRASYLEKEHSKRVQHAQNNVKQKISFVLSYEH